MSVHLFGIRHHGPGSARSLVAALQSLQPDVVLIEGPPEADGLIPLVHHPDMQPPVALLVYDVAAPSRSAFYPFAVFSPEWQAMLYAVQRPIPVHFIDLSGGTRVSLRRRHGHGDPLDALAAAAGYADSERWWEHMVEERGDDVHVFEAIQHAMSALRPDPLQTDDELEAAREATMRQHIRTAEKAGYQRLAVVCGAWHVPALLARVPATADKRRLQGLEKKKMHATWVPWTNGRLALESGYGAGVPSPGWYHHLWLHPFDRAPHWMTRIASLLRSEDLDASPAQTVDAVRLAMTLSAVRDRPRPALADMNDAALAVFAGGHAVPMRLIRDRLIVGETLGEVPSCTPQVALVQDVQRLQKRLRLKPEADARNLDLDLRQDNDRQRSLLLHRLLVLGVDWGTTQEAYGKSGTFHELWRLRWRPELSVALVEASLWGNTVEDAAAACVLDRIATTDDLARVTALLHQLLLAGLFDAVAGAVTRLEDLSAVSMDVLALMRAVPSLAQVIRYGSVRQTDTAAVRRVLVALMARVCIGLPSACVGLADAAAADVLDAVSGVDDSLGMLDTDDLTQAWQVALVGVTGIQGGSPLLVGRVGALLMDRGVWDVAESRRQLGLALSPAVASIQAAAWIEGFLKGRGPLLVHDDELRQVVDVWIATLSADGFTQVLPLLRRTFATFQAVERRQMGEKLAHGGSGAGEPATSWDASMVQAARPLLDRLLGPRV